jgi:hypothetical protein
MSNDLYLASDKDRPSWLNYPAPFHRLIQQDLIHLTPWHLLEAHRAVTHHKGLALRYPSRHLFPFAYRQDNDDVACWSKDHGEQVLVIHDFASEGWEVEASYKDFWSWFRHAIDETIAWE